MEQHRDELDEAHYQLMMDIYTRQGDDEPSPSRWWIGLALVLVVVGGATGLLLATGHRAHETPDARHTLTPTPQKLPPQLQMQHFQAWEHLPAPSAVSQERAPLPATPTEESRTTVTQSPSGSKVDPGSAGISSDPPTIPRHPKTSSARRGQMTQPQRTAACPGNDCRRRVTLRRSYPEPERSLVHEFDPNAARVLSLP